VAFEDNGGKDEAENGIVVSWATNWGWIFQP
jgi:hypothetical protein